MAKRKSDITEYKDPWEESTYQTGAIQPPRQGSGLVTILLAAVILLAGICSAMGLVNIRLLQKLSQMDQQTNPLSMESNPHASSHGIQLENLDQPEPQIPENRTLQLQTVQSPHYSQNADNGAMDMEQIYDSNIDSLVQVQCLTHFGATQTGMGLVLSSDGYILVNHHVVDSAKRIFVTLPEGDIVRAALVGQDSFSDLAVLYVDARELTAAVFSTNQSLQVADPSFAVPSPGIIQQSTIFTVSRTFTTKSDQLTLIQTCQGGSNGPVFNSFGHVIGLQVGNISQYFGSDDTIGTGLVIPTNAIRRIVDELVRYGHVDGRPRLGIEVEAISKVYQQYWQLPDGLLLTGIEKDSSAALSGLQEGDILVALDGRPITNRNDLYAALYNHQVGDTIMAVVYRDDQKFTVRLTVEKNEKQ